MKIKVEPCFGNNFYFRMTDPRGNREFVHGDSWTKEIATSALNIWEHCYHYKRSSIRFDHY